MLPLHDLPPRLCPTADAKLKWLARRLTKREGRVVTTDEAADLAVAEAAEKHVAEVIARSPIGMAIAALVAPIILDLMILTPEGTTAP